MHCSYLLSWNEAFCKFIIINNVAGAPIIPGGGTQEDTIPVAMITQADGAALKSSIEAGTATLYFGSKVGRFPNDLELQKSFTRVTSSTARQSQLTKNASDYKFELGTRVFNFGRDAQENATLKAEISRDGAVLDVLTSAPFNIAVGDTVLVTFPDYAPSTYINGKYSVKYTAVTVGAEGFPSDNEMSSRMYVGDSIFTNAQLDATTNLPNGGTATTIATFDASLTTCLPFKEANASRLDAKGAYFSALGVEPGSNPVVRAPLTDKRVIIELFEWNDVINPEAAVVIENIVSLSSVEYFYTEDLPFIPVYVPFASTIRLKDNQKYLVCATTDDEGIWFNFDRGNTDYSENYGTREFPVAPLKSGDVWNANGFGAAITPSIALYTTPAVVGVNEIAFDKNVKPFPMPALEVVTIPLNTNKIGNVEVKVLDLAGRTVATKTVAINEVGNIKVTTSDLSSGMYNFVLKFNDNSQSSFKVQINK